MATPAPRPTTTKRSTTSKRPGTKGAGGGLPENHTPSQAVAHAIFTQYGDLAPSVNRIMNSDLSEAGRLHAITLFRDSLGVPGDPNRHPAHAIEAARLVDAERPAD